MRGEIIERSLRDDFVREETLDELPVSAGYARAGNCDAESGRTLEDVHNHQIGVDMLERAQFDVVGEWDVRLSTPQTEPVVADPNQGRTEIGWQRERPRKCSRFGQIFRPLYPRAAGHGLVARRDRVGLDLHQHCKRPYELDIRRVIASENCMKVATLVVASMLGAQAVAAVPSPLSYEVERGRAYAERHCATCHAIGRAGSSPYPPAPPFRTLHERYDVEAIAEALAEGIVVGHSGARPMPQFTLSPAEIDDLLAYLKSLERK